MTLWFFILAKTEALCGQTLDILLLKGTKHQISMYDKMPMVGYIVSFMPDLHFISYHALLQKVCKQDKKK